MSLIDSLSLLGIMALLAAIPSSSVLLVVSRASSAGFAHGVAAIAGIITGDLIFVLITLLGLSALAEAMGSFFVILRVAAGLYLIWFGVSLIRSTAKAKQVNSGPHSTNLTSSALAGLFLTLGDVKAIFFYASLFPVFVDVANITLLDTVIIICLTIVAVGGIKLLYAATAIRVSKRIPQWTSQIHIQPKHLQKGAGGLLAAAGTYLIVRP